MYWSKYTNLLLLGPSLLMASTWAMPHEPIQPRSPAPMLLIYMNSEWSHHQMNCIKTGFQSIAKQNEDWKIPDDFELTDVYGFDTRPLPRDNREEDMLVYRHNPQFEKLASFSFQWSTHPSEIRMVVRSALAKIEGKVDKVAAIGTEDSDKMFSKNEKGEYKVVPKPKGDHKQSSATTFLKTTAQSYHNLRVGKRHGPSALNEMSTVNGIDSTCHENLQKIPPSCEQKAESRQSPCLLGMRKVAQSWMYYWPVLGQYVQLEINAVVGKMMITAWTPYSTLESLFNVQPVRLGLFPSRPLLNLPFTHIQLLILLRAFSNNDQCLIYPCPPRPKLYVSTETNWTPTEIDCIQAGIHSIREQKGEHWGIPEVFDIVQSHAFNYGQFGHSVLYQFNKNQLKVEAIGDVVLIWSDDPSKIQFVMEFLVELEGSEKIVSIGFEDSDKMFSKNREGGYKVVPKPKKEKSKEHKQISVTTV
ncbi:hypothetical protein EV360DRAFT_67910 [Lentinula raphanica]|nr:hypothetical protein EV360DRAFT_67910 [Lentinula raphanica]